MLAMASAPSAPIALPPIHSVVKVLLPSSAPAIALAPSGPILLFHSLRSLRVLFTVIACAMNPAPLGPMSLLPMFKTSTLQSLLSIALAMCNAPAGPILFDVRLRTVSVVLTKLEKLDILLGQRRQNHAWQSISTIPVLKTSLNIQPRKK
eukprot:gb/GEZN01015570.1/.p1 GENE.gb/GEZN01015570.1/~~gb/GEZN01015570.1/.p1  ORF type:complete len:171 (+),score=1.33 gb/GEZN01015570.1/:64-513(+)